MTAQRVLHVTDDHRLTLPAVDATTQTIVVYGGRGMGKTNFGSVLCEEFDAAGRRFSFIDPMGVAWGLRHSADGKGKGLDLLILGGRHGDLPIEHTGGKVIAEFVATATENVLIDISAAADGRRWSTGQKVRFVADYIERLLEVQGEHRQPLMQLIDEAARFAPETIQYRADKDDPIVRCKEMLGQLVEEGRNGAVGVTLLTQRSARMAKAVSELAEMMVAFRIVGPNSTQAVLDWFGSHVPKARHNELLEQLRTLPRGVALVVSPGWLEFEGVARIRMRRTFDSSATPTGTEKRLAGQSRPADLAALRTRIAETVEKAQADDPRMLRTQIADLKRQLAKVATQVTPKPEPIRQVERVEVPVVSDEHVKQLTNLVQALDDMAGRIVTTVAELSKDLAKAIAAKTQAVGNPPPKIRSRSVPTPPVPSRSVERRLAIQKPVASSNGHGDLDGPERRIVNAIAWLNGIGVEDPEQPAVAFLAGYTYNGGAFNNPRGRLRQRGLVEYVGGDRIRLTDQGLELAEQPEVVLTNDELHARVLERLPGPEQRLLKPLLERYPSAVSNEDLAKAANYTPNAGAFNNPRGRLRSLGLIEYPQPGMVIAKALLFPEGT